MASPPRRGRLSLLAAWRRVVGFEPELRHSLSPRAWREHLNLFLPALPIPLYLDEDFYLWVVADDLIVLDDLLGIPPPAVYAMSPPAAAAAIAVQWWTCPRNTWATALRHRRGPGDEQTGASLTALVADLTVDFPFVSLHHATGQLQAQWGGVAIQWWAPPPDAAADLPCRDAVVQVLCSAFAADAEAAARLFLRPVDPVEPPDSKLTDNDMIQRLRDACRCYGWAVSCDTIGDRFIVADGDGATRYLPLSFVLGRLAEAMDLLMVHGGYLDIVDCTMPPPPWWTLDL